MGKKHPLRPLTAEEFFRPTKMDKKLEAMLIDLGAPEELRKKFLAEHYDMALDLILKQKFGS